MNHKQRQPEPPFLVKDVSAVALQSFNPSDDRTPSVVREMNGVSGDTDRTDLNIEFNFDRQASRSSINTQQCDSLSGGGPGTDQNLDRPVT